MVPLGPLLPSQRECHHPGHWQSICSLGTQKAPLHQSSAIVGSRDVDENTRAEIQALFNRTFCLPENIDQLRLELEDFHL